MNNIEKKPNQTNESNKMLLFCFCFLLYLLRKKYDDAKAKQKLKTTKFYQIFQYKFLF